jgi:hypothetical protein
MGAADQFDFRRVLEGLTKTTFGPGAIGRIGTVIIAVCVCIVVLGLPLAFAYPWFALIALLVIGGVGFAFMIFGFHYADKHPQWAAMDGSQITKVMTHSPAVKRVGGMPAIDLDAFPVPNPVLEMNQAPEGHPLEEARNDL